MSFTLDNIKSSQSQFFTFETIHHNKKGLKLYEIAALAVLSFSKICNFKSVLLTVAYRLLPVLPLGSVALTSDCCLFQHQIYTLQYNRPIA